MIKKNLNSLVNNFMVDFSEFVWLTLSLAVGYFYAGYIIGFNFINNVSDISYLNSDMLQHFMAWDLFRYDEWFWPLTVTQRLQYPLHDSIVFTDSMPILSIFLKMLSPILPKVFVWHGLVAVVNSALQFYLGSKIFRSFRLDISMVVIGSLFILFATAMTNRFFCHYSLTSHWLILWSLYLILKPQFLRSDCWQNLLIIFFASGIHFYILVMCLSLSAALFYKIGITTKNWKNIIYVQVPVLFFVLLISLYLFGYFSITGSIGAGGVAASKLNSFFNPENYSLFFNGFPEPHNQLFFDKDSAPRDQAFESFQYLGTGIIIAFILAMINLFVYHCNSLKWANIKKSPLTLLIIINICLFIFSLSPIIYMSNILVLDASSWFTGHVFHYLYHVLRGAARMTWPLFYITIILSLVCGHDLLVRLYNKKLSKVIIYFLLIVQVVELIPLRNAIHEQMIANSKYEKLDGVFTNVWWTRLNYYKHINLLSIGGDDFSSIDQSYPTYFKLGMLASKYKLTLNTFYMSRGTRNTDEQTRDFIQGNLDDDGVYIIDYKLMNQLAQYNSPILQYCKHIDNFIVCTKHWY